MRSGPVFRKGLHVAIGNLQKRCVDDYLRRRGVLPSAAIGVPCVAILLSGFAAGVSGRSFGVIMQLIGAVLLSLYAGRRRSLRWSNREGVRDLVREADGLGVAIPSYGYWKYPENLWRSGRHASAVGSASAILLLISMLNMSTCGLGTLLLLRISGAGGAISRLQYAVEATRHGAQPGSAHVLTNDLDELNVQRAVADRALKAALDDAKCAGERLAQMRILVNEAEAQMLHLRKLQELDASDQAVIAEILETKRDVAATMAGIDEKISKDAANLDRKSMLLWWIGLISSIPLNILATAMAIRFGIGN